MNEKANIMTPKPKDWLLIAVFTGQLEILGRMVSLGDVLRNARFLS